MKQKDIINQVLNIEPNSYLEQVRSFRSKVVEGTQASYEALFSPALELNLGWRFAVAYLSSHLMNIPEFKAHYQTCMLAEGISASQQESIAAGKYDEVGDVQFAAILTFTAKLILKPIEGDKQAVLHLKELGIPTKDIIALSQLIAFLAYQLRLAAGLKALAAAQGA